MKPWMWGALLAVIAFLGWGVYTLASEQGALSSELGVLRANLSALETENAGLREKIEYFKQPENLLKELKSQFNYTEAGEKLLIVVPRASTSTAAASSTQ
jgi:cell division protein FtsB